MAQIYNSRLTNGIARNAKLQTARDRIPTQLADKVVPVMEVNPELLKKIDVVKHAVQTTTGTITLYTTSAQSEFYLSTIYAGFAKDAACNIATGTIQVIASVDGVSTVRIMDFPIITTTAHTDFNVIEFPIPIKIDKGTSITMSGTFGAGVLIRSVGLTGYEVENPNA